MKKLFLAFALITMCAGVAFADEDFDFRKAKWGMSSEECYDSEKFKSGIIKDEYDELAFKGMLFGKIANISYQFKENKLYKGYVIISTNDKSEAQEIFMAIKTKIAQKAAQRYEDDIYHYFYTPNTTIEVGLVPRADSYLILAGYRISDLEIIGLGKYKEDYIHAKDLEGF